MVDIIRGTTPTIIYEFRTVDVASLAVVILTVKSGSVIKLQKDLTDATAGEKSLTWDLTQEETLMFDINERAKMMLNYRLADGTRGASRETELCFRQNHIEEVI